MTRIVPFLQARRKHVAAGILLAGFAAALVIYLAAAYAPEDPSGYRPEDSKPYLRQMELYGGKANVFASELRQWFNGLWHGRALAYTVASLSLLLTLAVFMAFTPLSRAADPAGPRPRNRDAPDAS
jgi:hypothetical protein